MLLPFMAAAESAPREPALVRDAAAGDRAAFGRLYGQYQRMVHAILISRVPFHAVEDLVQDVFVAALDRIASLRGADSFGPWIATIARHRAIDYHRGKHATVELHEASSTTRPAPPEAMAAMDAIRSLPEAYCETLSMRLVEGLTGPEIATLTGLTPESVRVNLCRGMKLLREKLEGIS